MTLVLSNSKLDPRPSIGWPVAGGALSVDKRLAFKISCRRWLSAGHAVAFDVVVVVAAVTRGRKAVMAILTQTKIATAFITSGTGCRGLLPGDGAGFTARAFL